MKTLLSKADILNAFTRLGDRADRENVPTSLDDLWGKDAS